MGGAFIRWCAFLTDKYLYFVICLRIYIITIMMKILLVIC